MSVKKEKISVPRFRLTDDFDDCCPHCHSNKIVVHETRKIICQNCNSTTVVQGRICD